MWFPALRLGSAAVEGPILPSFDWGSHLCHDFLWSRVGACLHVRAATGILDAVGTNYCKWWECIWVVATDICRSGCMYVEIHPEDNQFNKTGTDPQGEETFS